MPVHSSTNDEIEKLLELEGYLVVCVLKRTAGLVLRDADVKDIPWGRPASFPVTLRDNDNAGAGIPGVSIHFDGTGVIGVSDHVTDLNGKATGTGTAPDTAAICSFTSQVHFAGNTLYRAANSPIRDYCTLKHDTTLSLSISPSTLVTGRTYVISGILKDRVTGEPLSSKTISFISDQPISVSDTVTDALGKFRVAGLKAPNTAGPYRIQAYFAGDSLYGAKNSVIRTLTVI